MLKLYSWNVNGIRAVIKKDALAPFIARHQPDILCLQETKAQQGQAVFDMPGYEEYWNSADKKGYSGTAIFTKIKPLSIINGLPLEIAKKYGLISDNYGDPNKEGRVIAAEFEKFYVVTVYTPNAKDDLSRIPLRHKQWDPAFLAYCKALETGTLHLDVASQFSSRNGPIRTQKYGEGSTTGETAAMRQKGQQVSGFATEQAGQVQRPGKPVIFCGDLNVAHTPDDLENDKSNEGKKGYTREEREGFQKFIDAGFVDTLRLFKQGKGYYTWWSHFANARARNVGWRIDYILVSESLKPKIKSADIHPYILGSDHCPVSISLSI